jgi:hypothetical protein
MSDTAFHGSRIRSSSYIVKDVRADSNSEHAGAKRRQKK